MQISLNKSLIL